MKVSRRKLRRALRLALRAKRAQLGDGFAAKEAAVNKVLRDADALDLLAQDIEDDVVCGFARPFGNTITEILEYILENWEEILEMIMAIISLFS